MLFIEEIKKLSNRERGIIALSIVAAGRYSPGLWIKDTWMLSSWWIKASVSNPLAEAFLRNDCEDFKNVFYLHLNKHLI